jgi:hypothetical protein
VLCAVFVFCFRSAFGPQYCFLCLAVAAILAERRRAAAAGFIGDRGGLEIAGSLKILHREGDGLLRSFLSAASSLGLRPPSLGAERVTAGFIFLRRCLSDLDPATSTPAALLLRVDDTKEDKHSDVQLDLLSISRLFFSRFSILNVGSVLSKFLV